MNLIDIARSQWNDYETFHQDRVSIWLHLFSVPLFWFGLLAIASTPWHESWFIALLGVAIWPIVFAVQGKGHKREVNPAKPFTSFGNAMARLVVEQLVTFPRYVLSGQASQCLRAGLRKA